MKKRGSLLKLLVAASALAFSSSGAWAQDKVVRLGVTPGPHAQIAEAAKQAAAKQGLTIQVIEFSDFIQPNSALVAGDLEANAYQHHPYLNQQVTDRGYKLVAAANTVILPIGLYSKRVKALDQLPDGAIIGVPNDPTNGGRALLLLQAHGLIKLRPEAGIKATPLEVVENPRKFKLKELDAAQLVHALDDLDAAIINTSYALAAKLNPTRDAIARESAESPYTNLIAVRAVDKDQPWVAQLVRAYQSEDVRQFIEQQFQGSIIPAY
ncbi:MetQ/NlpA family ABC transporter substrate-binding protein [Bordetella trematum]|uniref:MetQ/NlpA family ABC transporter substrate-binding protein n=1 Tax=Bordetella trematum TaxID=123899 RepID=UPI000D8AA1CF|nr:MetQ/NlpA family ABC transporter substrate-binding protein [Bordetella trematum]SPU50865.1 D-methionine ABC transporter substrate-binding protein [Bordetella trematum]VDH07112.1 D-methionine-binding lipoprotein metQ precursor [Bordetella trematum]